MSWDYAVHTCCSNKSILELLRKCKLIKRNETNTTRGKRKTESEMMKKREVLHLILAEENLPVVQLN